MAVHPLSRGITVDKEETRIDAKLALRVFQLVCERGQRVGGGTFEYAGMQALDVDGYSAMLTDGTVTVNILFHSKIALDTPNRRALARFRRKLSEIARGVA